jgi:hypothetical protein
MEKTAAVPSANARVVQIEIRQAAVVRKRLGMFENVANTPNRVNQGSRGVVIHFAAKAVDMDIHYVGCRINPHFPDMIEDHGPGHNSTLIAAKIFQQREFLRGQLQQMIAPSCFPPYQIEL